MNSLKELQDLIQEKYGIEPSSLDPDKPMREQGVDSLALAEFLFDAEDKFGISFPDTRTDVDTLAGLAKLVDELRSSQAA